MEKYVCEEIPSCTHYQSAICLHCNRRLCLPHIEEHNKIVLLSVENVSNELKVVLKDIKEDSDKFQITSKNVHNLLNKWRTEQISKLDEICKNQFRCFVSQQKSLQHSRQQLVQKLEVDVRQQIHSMFTQQNGSTEVLNLIQQKIESIRKESKKLQSITLKLPKITTEQQALNSPSNCTQQAIRTEGDNLPDGIQPTTKEITLSRLPITESIYFRSYRSSRLADMFGNISSMEQSKVTIHNYIQKHREYFKFPLLICSYLTAWHKISNIDEKIFLLNEHISTIQQYHKKRQGDLDVLVGIQVFFHTVKLMEAKYRLKSIFTKNLDNKIPAEELMTFLLEFFLTHKCITRGLILAWYHHKCGLTLQGSGFARNLATPFIQSISIQTTVNNVSAISTDQVNVEQHSIMEIKDEPVAID